MSFVNIYQFVCVCVCASFPVGFRGGMWDLLVSGPIIAFNFHFVSANILSFLTARFLKMGNFPSFLPDIFQSIS